MRIGNMRERVSLERPVQTKNSTTGAASTTWEIVALRSASISAISSKERALIGSEVSESTIMVRLRYDRSMCDITNEWRVVDQRTDRIYDIEGFNPILSGLTELKINCTYRSK